MFACIAIFFIPFQEVSDFWGCGLLLRLFTFDVFSSSSPWRMLLQDDELTPRSPSSTGRSRSSPSGSSQSGSAGPSSRYNTVRSSRGTSWSRSEFVAKSFSHPQGRGLAVVVTLAAERKILDVPHARPGGNLFRSTRWRLQTRGSRSASRNLSHTTVKTSIHTTESATKPFHDQSAIGSLTERGYGAQQRRPVGSRLEVRHALQAKVRDLCSLVVGQRGGSWREQTPRGADVLSRARLASCAESSLVSLA